MSDLKLNLGAGPEQVEGFTPLDVKNGKKAYPLDYADGSVAEIRASHILEHFSHRETSLVLADWVRALRPGGRLRLAVPDFDYIVEQYKNGSEEPLEGYLMGGHVDDHDVHLAMFNREKLRTLMEIAGLGDIRPWTSDVQDCAGLPVSLNLEGTKDGEVKLKRFAPPKLKVAAAMSVPRLGFMDNFFCAFEALLPLKIHLRKHAGAFWGQCLERCLGECLAEDVDAVLTLDYDTIFTVHDVRALIELMAAHPEADAIAALQASRTQPLPLMTIRAPDGKHNQKEVLVEKFQRDLLQVTTAHFGLTLIRASSLRELPHPWFKGEPGPDGAWDAARTDDDIWFWRQWEKAGRSLYMANRVVAGHAELMIRWPGRDFRAIFQHPSEFWKSGKPTEAWQ